MLPLKMLESGQDGTIIHRHTSHTGKRSGVVFVRKKCRQEVSLYPHPLLLGSVFLVGLLSTALTPASPTSSKQLEWPNFLALKLPSLGIYGEEELLFSFSLKVRCHPVTPCLYFFNDLLFAFKILKVASEAPPHWPCPPPWHPPASRDSRATHVPSGHWTHLSPFCPQL